MSSNAVVIAPNGSITTQQDFTTQQLDLIEHMIGFAPGSPEFDLFINIAKAKRLDPLTKQIYCIKTKTSLQMFASIDGLRVIAQRSGQYAGQVGPFWCGEDGKWVDVWLSEKKPAAARIGVLRKGWMEPMWGVATLKSYGKDSPTWNAMPDVMLAKVAESMALRKAFPDDLSALYVREDFDASDSPEPPINAPQANVAPLRAIPAPAGVDAETGEIAPAGQSADQQKLALGSAIRELRLKLGWDEANVRAEAKRQAVSLTSVAGLVTMVGVLETYVNTVEAMEEEDGEPEQGTLIEAETAPIDRWA